MGDDSYQRKVDLRREADAAKEARDKRDEGPFLILPHAVIKSPGYRRASYSARALLIDIFSLHTGFNNGALVATGAALRPLGWASESTMRTALADLLECGLLAETRKGGRNSAAHYALTWIDMRDGQHKRSRPHWHGAYKRPDKPAQTPDRSRTAKASKARKSAAKVSRLGYTPAPSRGAVGTRVAPSYGATVPMVAPSDGAVQAPWDQIPAPLDGAYIEVTICRERVARPWVPPPHARLGRLLGSGVRGSYPPMP